MPEPTPLSWGTAWTADPLGPAACRRLGLALGDPLGPARAAGAGVPSGASEMSRAQMRPAPLVDGEAGRDRPWWESDPRFSRYRD
jgi:hypothetical protein